MDWDRFLDTSSGRKFYYNSRNHEKSWKPPRCSSDGYSVPTSPNPCTDQSSASPGDTVDNVNTSTTSTSGKDEVSDKNKNSSARSEIVPSSSLDTAISLDNTSAAE